MVIPGVVVTPLAQRYFYITEAAVALDPPLVIPADQFTDDDGTPATQLMDVTDSGYSNLFINGVIQEGRIYDVGSNALTIHSPGDVLLAGTPVILQVIQLDAQVVI